MPHHDWQVGGRIKQMEACDECDIPGWTWVKQHARGLQPAQQALASADQGRTAVMETRLQMPTQPGSTGTCLPTQRYFTSAAQGHVGGAENRFQVSPATTCQPFQPYMASADQGHMASEENRFQVSTQPVITSLPDLYYIVPAEHQQTTSLKTPYSKSADRGAGLHNLDIEENEKVGIEQKF